MHKATAFMMGSVASHGGFVWYYTSDLSERWGEVVARSSQIWVEPPGTPAVGLTLLEAYRATKDARYVAHANTLAEALIRGQHPSGGWQYYIDFDPAGADAWRQMISKTHWGWEEYYYQYGNATFDDNTTAAPATFLLRLFDARPDEALKAPLLKALQFVLDAQRPDGAWPQRYPLTPEALRGQPSRYTGHATLNDGVTANNIDLLLEAHERLKDDRYRHAAVRGMDFYLKSQGRPPQAGWSQQYDDGGRPAPARTYEPAAVDVSQTIESVQDLQRFYRITGDRRYLDAVPSALDWLDSARLSTGLPAGRTHARFYEPGTNRPLFAYRAGTSRFDERVWFAHEFTEKDFYPYGRPMAPDLAALRREHARLGGLTAAEARAEYDAEQARMPTVTADETAKVAAALDPRGAWLSDVEILDPEQFITRPPRAFVGIATKTYIDNMRTLAAYVTARGKTP